MVCSRSRPLGLLAPCLALLCCGGPSRTYRDVVVDYSDGALELVAGRDVRQVFSANHDRVTAVAVMMSAPEAGAAACHVVFKLRARRRSFAIVEQQVPCASLPRRDWVRFDFTPLVGSRRQRLEIALESPDGRPGAAPAVLMASVPRIYPDGRLRVAGEDVPGALRFMTFHR